MVLYTDISSYNLPLTRAKLSLMALNCLTTQAPRHYKSWFNQTLYWSIIFRNFISFQALGDLSQLSQTDFYAINIRIQNFIFMWYSFNHCLVIKKKLSWILIVILQAYYNKKYLPLSIISVYYAKILFERESCSMD